MTSAMQVLPPIPLPTRRATKKLATLVADELAEGDLVVLSGPLGSGKTFLARAICRSLGVPLSRRVTSPTFALVHEHSGRLRIAHADLYRLDDERQLANIGLDALRDDGYVLLVEWGERYANVLGGDALTVTLELNPRRASLSGSGSRATRIATAVGGRAALLDARVQPG